MLRFSVYSLDVWGHSHDECCTAYGCKCVRPNEDTGEEGRDDECACEGFQVNDRSRVGTIEVEATDVDTLTAALIAEGFLKEEVKPSDLYVEGQEDSTLYVEASKDGRPIFQLERLEDKPATILDVARFRGVNVDDEGGISMGAFEAVGLPMFGGCSVCGASIAAYNAAPSRSGFLKCAKGCIGSDGFATAEEANRFMFPSEYEWQGVKPAAPKSE